MPNSKFFIGSYSGDVASRGATYASCDWASAVSASCQPVQAQTNPCTYTTTTPTNPYTYAAQPEAVSSAYYAPLPITSPCGCVDEPVVIDDPVYPDCPSVPTPQCPPVHDCGCHHQDVPTVPECPSVPDTQPDDCGCGHHHGHHHDHHHHHGHHHNCNCDCQCDTPVEPECPQEPVYPDCPSVPEQPTYPECPTVPTPPCPTEPFEPTYPDCHCHDEPDPCATTAAEIPAEAQPFANRRPRRRNRLNVQANLGRMAAPAQTDCSCQQQEEADPCVRPMPKRKHRDCHCAPEAAPSYAAAQQSCQTGYTTRYIDVPDEDACPKKKREKCFLYEKLKQYRRKGKTLCDFLDDYDEETFYAFIQE